MWQSLFWSFIKVNQRFLCSTDNRKSDFILAWRLHYFCANDLYAAICKKPEFSLL
jgi:hypothetical protein